MTISRDRIIEMMAKATNQEPAAVRAWFKGTVEEEAGWASLESFVSQVEEEVVSGKGYWIAAESVDKLARELDVAMNGTDAAPHPKLCDVVSQAMVRIQPRTFLRPALVKFSIAMETRLREKDSEHGENGWENTHEHALVGGLNRTHSRLRTEALDRQWHDPEFKAAPVRKSATDVANYAMFLFDNAHVPF